jgi:hypothetical protein
MIDTLPINEGTNVAGTVQRCVSHVVVTTTTHLEPAVADGAFDDERVGFDREWLEEKDTAEGRIAHGGSTSHLEIACSRKDDAAPYNVLCHDAVQCTSYDGAEHNAAVCRGQVELHKWM